MLLVIFGEKLENIKKIWYNIIKEKGGSRAKWNLLRDRNKV